MVIKFGALTVVLLALAGCGGSGSATPATPVNLSATLTVNGGVIQSSTSYTVGTTANITFQPTGGAAYTLNNVLLGEGLRARGSVTMLRAGSILLAGTYSSTTAKVVDGAGNQLGSFTVSATGALTQDVAIAQGEYIQLPITAIGSLTCPAAGIRFSAAYGTHAASTAADKTYTFTGTISPSGTSNMTSNGHPSVGTMNLTVSNQPSGSAAYAQYGLVNGAYQINGIISAPSETTDNDVTSQNGSTYLSTVPGLTLTSASFSLSLS